MTTTVNNLDILNKLNIKNCPTGNLTTRVLGYVPNTGEVISISNTGSIVEIVSGTEPIDGTSTMSLISGTTHTLSNSSTPGFTKTIVNTNANALTPFINSITASSSIRVARYDSVNNRMYIGGTQFTSIDGVSMSRIGYYDFGTSTWNAMGTGTTGEIYDIRIIGTDVYAGGNFGSIGGVTTNGIARWDTVLQTWNAMGASLLSITGVRRMAVDGNRLYVAGGFTNAGGNANADYICYWDTVLSTWNAMGTGTTGEVKDVIVQGGRVYIGGNFSNLNGNPNIDYFAYWDIALGTWNGYGANPFSSAINALVSDGTYVYIAGVFTSSILSNLQVDNIAKYEIATGVISQHGYAFGSNEFLYIDTDNKLWEGSTSASFVGSATLPNLINNSAVVSGSLAFFDEDLQQWAPFSLTGSGIYNMEQVGTTGIYWIVGSFSTNAFGNGNNPNFGCLAIYDPSKVNQITPVSRFTYGITTRKKLIMMFEGQTVSLVNYNNNGWIVAQPPTGNGQYTPVVWSGYE